MDEKKTKNVCKRKGKSVLEEKNYQDDSNLMPRSPIMLRDWMLNTEGIIVGSMGRVYVFFSR